MNTQPMTIEVQALLFDMDGTIIDSSGTCARIWGRWAEHYGLELEQVIEISHGRRPEDTATIILGADADIAQAVEIFTQEEAKETEVKTIAGASDLIKKIPQGKWAIVTSSTTKIVKERFERCGIPLPQSIVSADDVQYGKPHPEGYLKAAAELGVAIEHCVVFEDSPGGIEAGHRSGAKVIVMATTFAPSYFDNEMMLADLTTIELKSTPQGTILLSFTPLVG